MKGSEQPKNFVKEIREIRRLKQDDLAMQIGVSPATISNIESGRRGMSMQDLISLAKALKCRASDILGETDVNDLSINLTKIYNFQDKNQYFTINNDFLFNLSEKLDNLFFLKVEDGSMQPAINVNDIIIIDGNETNLINNDGKFAIIYNYKTLIREIKYNAFKKTIKIQPLNKDYEDEDLHNIPEESILSNSNLKVLGKFRFLIAKR